MLKRFQMGFRKKQKQDDYETEFMAALVTSRALGFQVPRFNPTCTPWLRGSQGMQCFGQLLRFMQLLQREQVSLQCFSVTNVLQEHLELTTGIPLFCTLGYIRLGKEDMFRSSRHELEALLTHPHKRTNTPPKAKLHAWLTTPGFEIIDATLATSYGAINEVPELDRQIIFRHHRDLEGGLQYHPQYVGLDYLRHAGFWI